MVGIHIRVPVVLCVLAVCLPAQPPSLDDAARALDLVPAGSSRLRPFVERYRSDRSILERSTVPHTDSRTKRFRGFYDEWRASLDRLPFDGLTAEERIDWILLRDRLRWRLSELEHETARDEACAALLPYKDAVTGLAEQRRSMDEIEGKAAATILMGIAASARSAHGEWSPAERRASVRRTVAWRAAEQSRELARMLSSWNRFHDGYDPVLSWWTREPYKAAREALDAHTRLLRELAGAGGSGDDSIIGEAIGKDALIDALTREMIPYSPEELIEIAEKELRWCEAEMAKASEALGFAGDWRAALDHVKGLHVEPGRQPALIKELAEEAVRFLEDRKLLNIPALCKETWRMQMMSPERQKVNPYFTGGEVISVSFPTDGMAHDDKLMSLRGNNAHFSRATVHHELIPGHHLQMYMTSRHRTWRRPFATPFWLEGWALYWELRLWDLGFPRGPEDKVGMLFWRMHRCARIIFSLGFHLGKLSPLECVDLLVRRVGHERRNAEAEVRRSVRGDYSPLYQAAYLLGGLQLRALQRELVGSGRMTDRAFHDGVLRQGSIPIEMVRAALTGTRLEKNHKTAWRFYE